MRNTTQVKRYCKTHSKFPIVSKWIAITTMLNASKNPLSKYCLVETATI